MKYKETFKRGLTAFAAAVWLSATSMTAHASRRDDDDGARRQRQGTITELP